MKGVIVAAGYGTRFLPATKSIPKEMFPIIDKPLIAFLVEEFIASGIGEIIVITSRRKKAVEDFLDREIELESLFRRENNGQKLGLISPPKADFVFVRQGEMMGTGHALMLVREIVGREPCIVGYPDDLHLGAVPLARQLTDAYDRTGCTVLAAVHDPPDLNRYGVLKLHKDGLHVTGFTEKPAPGTEPSREASIGRYLYTPDFFDFLAEGWEKHTGGEYYHAYALNRLIEAGKVVFHRMEGIRLDIGEPEGYLRALVRYAAGNPVLYRALEDEMKSISAGR